MKRGGLYEIVRSVLYYSIFQIHRCWTNCRIVIMYHGLDQDSDAAIAALLNDRGPSNYKYFKNKNDFEFEGDLRFEKLYCSVLTYLKFLSDHVSRSDLNDRNDDLDDLSVYSDENGSLTDSFLQALKLDLPLDDLLDISLPRRGKTGIKLNFHLSAS